MRNIRGDLGLVGIENLLQMLSNAKCEGTLAVVQESQKKVIHLGTQGIRLISGARRTHPLGEILTRAGKITLEQLEEMLAEQKRSGARLGDIVARRGIVSKEEIDFALREQIAEEIYDLFSWKGALFTFTEGGLGAVPDNPLSEIVMGADVMFVILEAGRRADEMMKFTALIPDERVIPVRQELPAAIEGSDLDRRTLEAVVPLIDGDSSVAQIIGKSLYPKFTVLRVLYGLADRGMVKICRREGPNGGPETVLRRVPPSREPAAPTGRTVLLMSGMPTFRAAVAASLRDAGYAVVEEDVGPGLEKLPGMSGVSAVVADVPLETPEGAEVCARLREAQKAPFVVMTSHGGREAVIHAIDSGARHVLLKPVRPELLLQRLSETIGAEAVTS
jgi:CheY-like chemotaxis protein